MTRAEAFTNTEWIAVKALLIAAIAIEDPDEKVSILDAALDRAWIHGRHAGEVAERERCARIADEYDGDGHAHGQETQLGDSVRTQRDIAAAIRSLAPAPEVK